MAWVDVPTGSGGTSHWEYDNAATRTDTYPDSPGTITAGVRSYTNPRGVTTETYIKARKAGGTLVGGEISKTYYDNQ
jgi:hypothetical protein